MSLFPSGSTARHGRGALAAGWLLAALSPPGASASNPPHEAQVAGPTEQIAALDQAIPGLMARAGIPGLSIAVVQNGEVAWTGAYDDMLARHTSMRGGETKTEHPQEIWQAIHWGLGWGIQDAGGGQIYFHWGDNDVYHAFAAFSQAHGTGFVYFTNSRNGLRIANQLATIVVGDMSPAITWLGYGGPDTEPDDGN